MISRHAQELNNVGVADLTQNAALLFKSLDDAARRGVLTREKRRVQDFCGTRELVAFCLIDSAIGTNAQTVLVRLEKVEDQVTKASLDAVLLLISVRHLVPSFLGRKKLGKLKEGLCKYEKIKMVEIYTDQGGCNTHTKWA